MALRVEFTVEPFVDGAPGPHVTAALDAARASGAAVEFGPFGTTAEGADDLVLDVVSAVLRAAMGAGATALSLRVERV